MSRVPRFGVPVALVLTMSVAVVGCGRSGRGAWPDHLLTRRACVDFTVSPAAGSALPLPFRHLRLSDAFTAPWLAKGKR